MAVTDKPILEALGFIAEFVNTVSPDLTREQWRAYLKQYVLTQRARGRGLVLGPLVEWRGDGRLVASVTLREAKRVRQFIVSDLRYLHFDREGIWTPGDPLPKPKSPFEQTSEHPLAALLLRLSETFKAGTWQCVAVGAAPLEPGLAVCRLKRKKGRIQKWAASFSPFGATRTLQEWVYTVLGKALLSGLLGQFRLCPVCARYFVPAEKGGKRVNCSDRCKEKASGGADRVQRWREDKRELMLKRARAMQEQGKSNAEIQQATKLSARVLKKGLAELKSE